MTEAADKPKRRRRRRRKPAAAAPAPVQQPSPAELEKVVHIVSGMARELDARHQRDMEELQKASQSFARSTGTYEPPFDLTSAASYMELEATHKRCILCDADYVVGHGYRFVTTDRPDVDGRADLESMLLDETDEAKRKAKATARIAQLDAGSPSLRAICRRPNDDCDFTELNHSLRVDVRSVGNAYAEVVRTDAAQIKELHKVSCYNVRVLRTGAGYVQYPDRGAPTYFRKFGDLRRMYVRSAGIAEATLGKVTEFNLTAPEERKRSDQEGVVLMPWRHLHRGSGDLMLTYKAVAVPPEPQFEKSEIEPPRLREGMAKAELDNELGDWHETLKAENLAMLRKGYRKVNELIHFREYSTADPHYGTPDWYAAATVLNGVRSAHTWNDLFFKRGAAPGLLLQALGYGWNEESKQAVLDFITARMMGNPYQVMLVDAPTPESELKIEHIGAASAQDAGFKDFIPLGRGIICFAHGIPESVVMSHSDRATTAGEDIYRWMETVEARQKRWSAVWGRTLLYDMGAHDWEIGFRCANLSADAEKRRILLEEVKNAVRSPNEYRLEFGMAPVEGGEYCQKSVPGAGVAMLRDVLYYSMMARARAMIGPTSPAAPGKLPGQGRKPPKNWMLPESIIDMKEAMEYSQWVEENEDALLKGAELLENLLLRAELERAE